MARIRYDRSLPLAVLACLTSLPAFGQAEWSEARNGIKALYGSMGRLLTVSMLLGALVVLTMIVLKVMRGEREAAARLVWWLVGLVFGLVMLSLLMKLAF